MRMSRRAALGGFFAVALTETAGISFAEPSLNIHVTKGRGCGCCTAWTKILEEDGFKVTEDSVHPADLVQLKTSVGVPENLMSCHTAKIAGYVVEGHVPPKDIRRLLSDKPEAVGIAVAGMPYGSPGMGPEDEREAYDVILFKEDGSQKAFSSYDASSG